MPKIDRIKSLVPIFEAGRFYMPRRIIFRDLQGRERDFVSEMIHDEYLVHPVGSHDDILDCLARILDPELPTVFPMMDYSTNTADFSDSVMRKKPTTNHTYNVLAGVGKKSHE